jgi:hypothetical protein
MWLTVAAGAGIASAGGAGAAGGRRPPSKLVPSVLQWKVLTVPNNRRSRFQSKTHVKARTACRSGALQTDAGVWRDVDDDDTQTEACDRRRGGPAAHLLSDRCTQGSGALHSLPEDCTRNLDATRSLFDSDLRTEFQV